MAAVSSRMWSSLELCLMCLPSDLGSPRAWIIHLPALRWGLGAPQTGVLSSSDNRPQQAFLHQAGDIQNICCSFCPWASPGLCAGTSQPCDVEAFLLIATLGLCRPGLPHTPPQPTPLHRSVKEPVWTRGSSGTSLREHHSLGCLTQRGLWKVGGTLFSTLGWPISTHSRSA